MNDSLLSFQKWLQSHNILPWQQSGARANQSTNSRVNHLLEQLTNSLWYNTFTPVLFIDFKQTFDMLWQEGLILKLNRLNCPITYLFWITNYFKDRSMTIDLNGLLSDNITIFFFNMLILLLHSEVLTRGGRKPLQLFDSRSLE